VIEVGDINDVVEFIARNHANEIIIMRGKVLRKRADYSGREIVQIQHFYEGDVLSHLTAWIFMGDTLLPEKL
jgi:hypothetical protein